LEICNPLWSENQSGGRRKPSGTVPPSILQVVLENTWSRYTSHDKEKVRDKDDLLIENPTDILTTLPTVEEVCSQTLPPDDRRSIPCTSAFRNWRRTVNNNGNSQLVAQVNGTGDVAYGSPVSRGYNMHRMVALLGRRIWPRSTVQQDLELNRSLNRPMFLSYQQWYQEGSKEQDSTCESATYWDRLGPSNHYPKSHWASLFIKGYSLSSGL